MGHAALTTSIQEFGQPTHASADHSFLTTSIEAAELYLAGRITDARLYQALSQVERELKAFLDGAKALGFKLPTELHELAHDGLSLLADLREGPLNSEQVGLYLEDARYFHREFVALGTASICYQLKKRTAALKAKTELAEPVEGLYHTVRAALRERTCSETLSNLLDRHYDQVNAQLKSFRAIAGPDQWTSLECLGDQLVVHGLTLWLEGLEILQESILFARESLQSEGLARLLEGHRSMLAAQ